MTKFPNPFELLEKKKNLEDMQNINDAKNIGNTAKDKAPGIATDAFNTTKDKAPGIATDVFNTAKDKTTGVASDVFNTAKDKAPGIATDVFNTAKDKATGVASDLAGDVQDEVISAGQQVKNSKYVDYIYPTIIAILLFVFNSICYSNIFSKYQKELNEKIIGEVENDSFWILRKIPFLFVYLYLSICIVLFVILYFVFDILNVNYLYYTFIVHLGITGLLLFVLSFIPSLVEIFENSFGISMLKLSKPGAIKKFFDNFATKAFPSFNIDLTFFLSIFSISTFKEDFKKFITFTIFNNDTESAFSDLKLNGLNETDGLNDIDKEALKAFIDNPNYDNSKKGSNQEEKQKIYNLREELFKLLIKKYENGHFMWTYFSSIITTFIVLVYMT